MKYAIIGSGGFIAKRHKQVIKDMGNEVVLTCDINPYVRADFLDYKEMLVSKRMGEVDAIVICTPNHCHKQMARDSLAFGKEVLVEKPLCVDDDFSCLEGVNVVLQLRHHSLTPEIRKVLTDDNKINLTMKVYRDEHWWKSWRNDFEHNGSILMTLAIHMFDYLIFLLGNEYEVIESSNSVTKCTGIIKFPKALVNYHVEVMEHRGGQTRSYLINGHNFEMCDKENLSFAGYHDIVHREFLAGRGVPLSEAKKAIELILKL